MSALNMFKVIFAVIFLLVYQLIERFNVRE